MKSFKEHLLSILKYSIITAIFSFASFSAPALADGTAGKDLSGRKYCVILRPDVKPSPEAERVLVGAPAGDVEAVRTAGKASFFKGGIQKLGFGAPECFFINRQIKSNPVTGAEGLHAGPDERLEAIAEEKEVGDFFPAAGFFNRTSFGSRGGLAIGAGISGVSPAPGEAGGVPEAKVSLMFGFGF